jgi:hypothetical protein
MRKGNMEQKRSFLRLGVLVLALAPFPGLFAQEEKLVFLPDDLVYQPLIGDPREPHYSITLRSGGNPYEGAIGSFIELLQWRPRDESRWSWGILGAGYIGLGTADSSQYPARQERVGDILYYDSFPEHVSDWYLGTYFAESLGAFSNRLEYTHVSSHLGDELFGYVDPFIYTQESLRLTSSFRPDPGVRLYAGAGYFTHVAPADNRLFFHGGAELYLPYWRFIGGTAVRGYFTYDLKVGGEDWTTVDQSFQLGFQWKGKAENSRALRAALVGYLGDSQYGQFYLQQDNYWGVGFYFDP